MALIQRTYNFFAMRLHPSMLYDIIKKYSL
jgi:hypothetical protein